MSKLFRLTRTATVVMRQPSWDACTYLFRAMRIAGWLPSKVHKYHNLYLLWSLCVFCFSTVYLPIGYVLSLFKDLKYFTPGEFLSVVQLAIEAGGVSLRSIVVIFFMSRLLATRLLLNKLDEHLNNNKDRLKIQKASSLSNYVFIAYGKLFLAYTLSMLATGILRGKPPWLVYNPFFDWRKGSLNYWMQAVLEYIVVTMAVFLDLISDTFTLVYMIIFRAHIDVLKDHICELRTDPDKTESENHDELVNCIIYHKLILKCCDKMRPVMSTTIFIQFLLIGAVLGLTMINLRSFSDLFSGFCSVVYLAALLLETFPFCFLCDLLVEDCENLSNLLGQSHWVDAEPKYKTTLKIFMHHVQQPITFQAGGIFPISMNTNIKVAKFSFSVMTIVEQMNLTARFK